MQLPPPTDLMALMEDLWSSPQKRRVLGRTPMPSFQPQASPLPSVAPASADPESDPPSSYTQQYTEPEESENPGLSPCSTGVPSPAPSADFGAQTLALNPGSGTRGKNLGTAFVETLNPPAQDLEAAGGAGAAALNPGERVLPSEPVNTGAPRRSGLDVSVVGFSGPMLHAMKERETGEKCPQHDGPCG